MKLLLVASLAGTLWPAVDARRIEGAPVRASIAVRQAYTSLVADLARAAPRGAVPPTAADRAKALGLRVVRSDGLVWLREPADGLEGRGVVVLRLGPVAAELVLSAPHPVTDLRTGPITAGLFEQTGARAACFATIRRDAAADVDPSRDVEGWLQSATEGLARALPAPLFVQVHGFDEDAKEADFVVSQGQSLYSERWVVRARDVFEAALGVVNGRTGEEVPLLAARSNAQSGVLSGRSRFLHLELSFSLRDRLTDEAPLRNSLGAAMVGLTKGAHE